jgi:hypothetical protein
MREGLSETAGDDLSFQALLYASGELEGEELAAFEEKLSLDQSARDALAQAVELSLTMEGKADQGPEPEVRARIRQRLRQRRRKRLADGFATGFIGQPAFWSLIGALVTLMLLLLFGQVLALFEATPKPPAPPQAPSKSDLEARRTELETQARRLATELSMSKDPAKLQSQLKDLSRQLVHIDIDLQKLRVGELEKEIQRLKADLAGDQLEDRVQKRYDSLIQPK